MNTAMTFDEALARALAAYDAAGNDDDGATNFVATIVTWWIERTPGATPADLFVGEETLVVDVDGEGSKCFKKEVMPLEPGGLKTAKTDS